MSIKADSHAITTCDAGVVVSTVEDRPGEVVMIVVPREGEDATPLMTLRMANRDAEAIAGLLLAKARERR